MTYLATSWTGRIAPPPFFGGSNQYPSDITAGGPALLISNIIKTMVVIAALYALFNFLFAGFSFLSAGGDPKKIEMAWSKIWQSVLGLAIVAGALTIGAIISNIMFGSPTYIFQLRIFRP